MGEVLITGGAGFLGRYLANGLAASGNSVTVLDDLSCSNSTFDCAELQHERQAAFADRCSIAGW
jgi:nucleoside-diphosphate-sugar epimerase